MFLFLEGPLVSLFVGRDLREGFRSRVWDESVSITNFSTAGAGSISPLPLVCWKGFLLECPGIGLLRNDLSASIDILEGISLRVSLCPTTLELYLQSVPYRKELGARLWCQLGSKFCCSLSDSELLYRSINPVRVVGVSAGRYTSSTCVY